MKKRNIIAVAAALAVSSMTGTAISAPTPAPARAMELSPCQLAEYMRCLKGGDHNWCVDWAQTYDCVD